MQLCTTDPKDIVSFPLSISNLLKSSASQATLLILCVPSILSCHLRNTKDSNNKLIKLGLNPLYVTQAG